MRPADKRKNKSTNFKQNGHIERSKPAIKWEIEN